MNKHIESKIDAYPAKAKAYLLAIRAVIYEVAEEEKLGDITESLKWNEPSYSAKKGSPIRIDWKPKNPHQVSVFFDCKTTLADTFKELYIDQINIIGNREIALPLADNMPLPSLKKCISFALRYHTIKHLPLLGA